MKDKMQQAIEASQQDVIVAAEQKLGRPLSDAERRGIQSLMRLCSKKTIETTKKAGSLMWLHRRPTP
jgi:hypothetical protein